MSSAGSSGPGLALVSNGAVTDASLIGFLIRSMDPENKDDNCLKCLSQNEAISQF